MILLVYNAEIWKIEAEYIPLHFIQMENAAASSFWQGCHFSHIDTEAQLTRTILVGVNTHMPEYFPQMHHFLLRIPEKIALLTQPIKQNNSL
jgi:hypothetical protein